MAEGRYVRVRGLNEVVRALERLPAQAQREARRGAVKLSRDLANRARASGRASDRQSARASRSVRARTIGTVPGVVAGPHPLLFGSEFGVKRRFGWYRKGRYYNSPKRQFRGRNPAGYWFFPVADDQGEVRRASQEIADAIIRDWSA